MSFINSMCRWGMFMGLTGIVCGFLGPLYFVPWANLAPAIGIAYMGTLCTLIGLFTGGSAWMARRYIY